MELVLTLLGIGIACVIVGLIAKGMDDSGNNVVLGLLQVAGLYGGLITLCALLPLAILVKLVQYFWNF